jgi:hypothetical protein
VDYDGTDCQTKRDDCALSPCAHGSCTDGLRTRSCACDDGFSGSSCSTNNNECSGSNVCTTTYPCVDYTGNTAGYTCRGQFPDWTVPTFGVGRFTFSLGVVTDTQTGLQWQQSPSASSYTWSAAKTHCPNDVGTGWRLPTLAELLSIVKYDNNPPYDTGVFTGVQENYFWTSSPTASSANYAWTVFFTDGSTAGHNVTGPLEHYVFCVR